MRNVLLIEPNYKNKYPPIGLMKLATYYRKQGDKVVFFKGDLKDFVIKRISMMCVERLSLIENDIAWNDYFVEIAQFIKTRKKEYLYSIYENNANKPLIDTWLDYFKNYYHKEKYKDEPEWDVVCITTLFTFHWDITIDTIQFAKSLVKKKKNLFVGGVMATILSEEIEKETGILPHKGTLSRPGILDKMNNDIIDELPLDYSILDEIDYQYPDNNAYYGYTTRGCINKCSFCAVPTLEPEYNEYLPLMSKLNETAEVYGEQRNLLLMDNNILASPRFPEIIKEIKDAGFSKSSKFIEPNLFEISVRNLRNGINDAAYTRKLFFLIKSLEDKISDFQTKEKVYSIREDAKLLKLETTTKCNLLDVAQDLSDIFEKHQKKTPKQRYVDFNQGVDARLFNLENVKLLSEIPVRPLRIAFDDIKSKKYYLQAIKWSADAGIKEFSNYLLYNYKDKPLDLYHRLKINVDLCVELGINIYSFPMKYHPIKEIQYFKNRNFIGEHWSRKSIRAVQAILNSTKGKIGKGKSFFEKAFGANEEEFLELLIMPETFIIYRFFFEHIGYTQNWRSDFNDLSAEEKTEALTIIHQSDFVNASSKTSNPKILNVLSYYTNYRSDIITEGTELYRMKQEYDAILKSAKEKSLVK